MPGTVTLRQRGHLLEQGQEDLWNYHVYLPEPLYPEAKAGLSLSPCWQFGIH